MSQPQRTAEEVKAAPTAPADSTSSSSAAAVSASAGAPVESVRSTPLTHIHPDAVPSEWTVEYERYRDEDGKLLRLQHPESLTCTRISQTPLMFRVEKFLAPEESAEIVRLATAPAAANWRRYHNVNYTPTYDDTGAVIAQDFTVAQSDKATLHQLDFGHYNEMRPIITLICRRVAKLVNVPQTRISNLRRLLRYQPGQRFDLHADDYDRLPEHTLPRGKRMLTCLIYVHTEPDETGGGTMFPLLDGGEYRSAPTSGSLLIFRNFDPQNAGKFDSRCQHYAETTTKGYKYALNLYIVEEDGRWWN